MADANMQNFDKRMQKILTEHQRLSRGYVTSITRDGLIVARPRRRFLPRVPWRGVLMILIAAMAFKAYAFHYLGQEAYEARVASMTAGTSKVERIGAYVMKADPLTLWISEQITALTAQD